MAATVAAHGNFKLGNGMSVEEHNELVKSVEPLRGSVGRIILAEKKDVVQTGTASLVYKGAERNLFLTCSHNFGKKLRGEVIRLPNGDKTTDYLIEHIVYRHESRDLLLFSVKENLPQCQCLEFSSDEVKDNDKVVLVGFSGAPLQINDKELVPAPVVAHSILTGVVRVDPYTNKEGDLHYRKIFFTSRGIQGHSGSPLFKNGKIVAVHIAADKNWRDGVSAETILHSLREHLGVGTDNEDTIDKLLERLYNKIGEVPYGELQHAVKKSKRTTGRGF